MPRSLIINDLDEFSAVLIDDHLFLDLFKNLFCYDLRVHIFKYYFSVSVLVFT